MTAPMLTIPQFSAMTLPDGRRAGLCLEDKPRCVAGVHYVKSHRTFADENFVICQHEENRSAPHCNASLFLARFHFGGSAMIREAGTRLWLVVEMRSEHLRHLKNHPMTIVEKLHYLNAALPGVYDDLLKDNYRELRR